MQKVIVSMLLAVLVWGCSSYKQLKPKPEIVARESGYIQILNNDKIFEIKPNKRYFMEFPQAPGADFYLVLQVQNLSQISSYLTQQFDKNPKTPDPMIPNESETPDVLAYPVGNNPFKYVWVIDQVAQKMPLNMEYRYIPKWRYKFETKYSTFETILARNKADRELLQDLSSRSNISKSEVNELLAKTDRQTAQLEELQKSLGEIESLFPPNIKNSDDRAYLDYLGMKNELKEELAYQNDLRVALKALKTVKDGEQDNQLFLKNLPDLLKFFENETKYPEALRKQVADAVANRLSDIVPFYEKQVQRQRDLAPIDFPVDAAKRLYERTNQRPDRRFEEFARFVEAFNRDLAALESAQKQLSDIRSKLKNERWPSAAYYNRLRNDVQQLRRTAPNFNTADYGRYRNNTVVMRLESEIDALNSRVSDMQRGVDVAASIADEINSLKNQGDYSSIIRLLKKHSDIAFLRDQYGDVDQLSINKQEQDIRSAMENRNFAEAERRIEALYNDRNFLDYDAFAARKISICKNLEEELLQAIETYSKSRVNEFIRQNQGAITNVEALYNSEAFRPAHVIRFSAGGPNVVERYNQRLQNYLDDLKYNDFPKASIQEIYNSFIKNPRDNGVAKAKAIITHGKYYKGNDRRIKAIIQEIDPNVAKWITKPTEYRRIFVIPVNDTQQKVNQYKFKINLKIPSDAKFPVFDVNIKLPREVAQNAQNGSWYDSITLNGKVLKNEGRFTITAPMERNDFECQITPLQVNKDGDNILEVTFKHDAFKVLEISVMAQRPIIRRD
jgi:hypothetical protein